MKHSTILLLLSLCFAVNTSAQVAENDSADAKVLNEVEITADNYIHKDGYDLLLLSKANREFGTNALDAISSMSRFLTSLNETKLFLWDRSEVFILINGVPSTAEELRTYSGNDIKNVKFYSVAPPQYMAFTSGAVVDVIIKKRHDMLFSGYFNTVNAVNTGFGTNQANLTFRDSLNQVKVDYFVDYRNIGSIDKDARYEYSPSTYSQYRERQRYKGAYHRVASSYQYFSGKHLFNTKVSGLFDGGETKASGTRTLSMNESATLNSSRSLLKSNSRALSLDMYYGYTFDNGSLFAVDVVNTFGKSYSESSLNSYIPDTDINNSVFSRSDNDSYSLIATGMYVSRMLGGQFSAVSRYEYKRLKQQYLENIYKPYNHDEFVNVGMYWRENNMTFMPTLGLTILKQVDQSDSFTTALPYLRLYYDWWPQGKLKGLTFQVTLNRQGLAPSLSMLTGAPSYMDYYYYSTGNPDLKNYSTNTAMFSIAYFAPNSQNYISFIAWMGYSDKPIASTIDYSGNNPILMPKNINYSFDNFFSLTGSWYPFPWLEINPYIELNGAKSSTPSHRTNMYYMRYGGKLAFHLSNWEFVLAANSPTKEFDGDLYLHGSPQFAATVQYKYRNWAFGGKFNYSGHNDFTRSLNSDFKYQETFEWKPLRELVRLSVVYSFNIGRSRRHSDKYLNESDDVDALNKYNTPRKP